MQCGLYHIYYIQYDKNIEVDRKPIDLSYILPLKKYHTVKIPASPLENSSGVSLVTLVCLTTTNQVFN